MKDPQGSKPYKLSIIYFYVNEWDKNIVYHWYTWK